MDWLVEARKKKGYTQAKVAELVGIARGSYANIETGKRGVPPKTAKKIANVLGFKWTKFFE